MNIIKKIAGIVLIIIGALLLLINFIPGDPVAGITIAAALFIIAGVFVMKKPKSEISSSAPEPASSEPSLEEPVVAVASSVNIEPEPHAASSSIKYSFNVAGVSYHERDLKELLLENDEYNLGKRDLVDCGLVDERVYKYLDGIRSISLVPDPDNEHDPNAIKVVADGVLIGFVPADKTRRVRNIIEARKYTLSWDILGGPYKIVREDYDDERDREVYSLERESMNLGVKVHIEYEK